ncbi:MAG: DUF4178 domain-containing protein [Proteobacteria bacterium]|nr:DUF4178 domain-containing protein [Pseudomonadota bacterium]MBU1583806.1 DUF4178 domain-containing protein [Pseudomonadota bacterium]MBU2455467.1 DUF4178 domain-containing protein [Pseudomonadota bacterium]MBU2627566.1 DUF4178 domain-containing protein [Pseudomonadota bacterium]
MLDIATQKSFQERLSAIRSLKKDHLVSGQKKSLLGIKDAGKTAFFEYLGNTYFVKDLNQYEETSDDFKNKKGYFIHELTCLCLETGQSVNFEWEFDDELEVSMTLERLLFRNLKDDQGEPIDEDDLDQIADDKDVILINGEKFWYEDDWASLYYRGGKEEKVYMYEFENESHTKFLTIEEWSGSGREAYQIYTSSPVDPNSISLISKGEL